MRIAHPARSLISFHPHFNSHFSSPAKRFLSLRSLQLPKTKTLTLPLTGRDGPRFSMAEVENVSTAIDAKEDAKFGFTRPEMYKGNLAGTVDSYDRHVFLCYESPYAWLSHIEKSEANILPKLLSMKLKDRKNDITVKTKMTICDGGEGTGFENGDVLIFPEMIKYKGLADSNIDGFVDDVLVHGKPWASGVPEVLTGSYIFVCAHGSRDKRCGVCGPVLMEKLKEGIECRGLKDQVFVKACSHIGGHKYAGNLIIYSPDPEGKIMGHWYGYVTPDDVPEVLDQHIGKGVVIERIWRGQMGGSLEGEKAAEQHLPNGKDVKENKKHEESSTKVIKDNASGCCQGANGVSCCRDASSEVGQEKKLKENIEAEGKKGVRNLSSWIGSLEQADVLAAVAVVGAVATIAVAYSLYKRSG